ncbi:MAG: nucleotide sugar dehydrogenase [Candidatus Thermoplasmatota archaeon]|nr:nucleotide sugar dehydrogenase [Candidatus Thermoplasmatota archaeon]
MGFEVLLEKIAANKEVIGIMGLGYVGLPLAVAFAGKGVHVLGFEKSEKKVENLINGKNYIADVSGEDLASVIGSGTFTATTDFSRICECDAILICVPTPLDKFKKPDMSYIKSACEEIAKYMKKGTFIALESTTYPTTTENFMLPIIESKAGMKHGKDFWLAYSPERVDPGNKTYKTENTPKVFGAMTEEGKQIGLAIYQKAIQYVYPVSSPRIAEMVKILENTYRLINISMINELALLCGKMDIDIWEVIEAAKTKPYGFHAFYPGPGIGGHCIPLDPFYLEYIAKNYQFDLTMIHTAGHIDMLMPHRMTIKITSALNKHSKSLNGAKVMFLGVAYKPDINDERESPALKIIDEVVKKGAVVFYHDPFIPSVTTESGLELKSSDYRLISEMDVVVVTTKHSSFSGDDIVENSKLVVDLTNITNKKASNIYKL